VEFLEGGISDHSPALFWIERYIDFGPRPFKFFNFWADCGQFLEWVAAGWNIEVAGYSMFQLYSRLKAVKSILKTKNLEVFGGLRQKVLQARQKALYCPSRFSGLSWGCCSPLKRKGMLTCLHFYCFC
jgi:hypothetical protein